MLKVYEFGSADEIQLFLNGGILGGLVGNGFIGLVGKTLTFTAPAGTVTFVSAGRPNDVLLLSDVKSQIETALTAVAIKVMAVRGRVAFVHPTGTSAIALDGSTEAGKSILGFDGNTSTSGKVYGAVVGTPPAVVALHPTVDNGFVLLTVE